LRENPISSRDSESGVIVKKAEKLKSNSVSFPTSPSANSN